MVPTGMRRCLMAIAAVVALLATQHAFAADQCVLELTSAPGPDLPLSVDRSDASPELEEERPDALVIEGDKVPISLSIGASAIAPRTVHAISDAAIEADRSCERPLAGSHGTVGQDDPRDRAESSHAVEAWLGRAEPAPAAGELRVLSFSPPATAPARGVMHPVERPPRR